MSHPYPKGQLSLMGDKCQHLHCQYGASSLHQENSSSYCRQQLKPHLNLGEKILSDEILLSADLTAFCARCHEPVLWKKGGSLRGKQRKGEEGWCPSPTLIHTYRVGVTLYKNADWESHGNQVTVVGYVKQHKLDQLAGTKGPFSLRQIVAASVHHAHSLMDI